MTATQTRHATTWRDEAPDRGEASGSDGRSGQPPRRAYFFLLPNLADDSDLDVYAFRLLAHYQRVAGPHGACTEPTAATAQHCRMSPRRVVQARTALVEAGWIALTYDGVVGQQVPVVGIVDRMADNVARYGRGPVLVTPSAPTTETIAPEAESTPASAAAPVRSACRPPLHLVQPPPAPAGRSPDKTPEDTGLPPLTPLPSAQQQRGKEIGRDETVRPGSPTHDRESGDLARSLVVAFYRGLEATPLAATVAMQRRDLAIARQLAVAGATPEEAEAYAREMSGLEGRLAPVDLRSFERERPGWLVRHRRQQHRHVDRTGQPPTWLAGAAEVVETAAAREVPEPPPGRPGATRAIVPAPGTHTADLAGGHLGTVLRTALLPGGR